MVKITEKGFIIEVETPAPYEDLSLLASGLLQMLRDATQDYTPQFDPRPQVCSLLQELLPNRKQFEKGLKAV